MKETKKTSLTPYAVIYPLPLELASRILSGKKSVFVKYQRYEVLTPMMNTCEKILFYISHSKKEILGEASISAIQLMSFDEVISEFKNDLFLSEDELRKYSNKRIEKKMLVFSLKKMECYSEPKLLGRSLTMVGEFISKQEYDYLVKD